MCDPDECGKCEQLPLSASGPSMPLPYWMREAPPNTMTARTASKHTVALAHIEGVIANYLAGQIECLKMLDDLAEIGRYIAMNRHSIHEAVDIWSR